MKKALLNIIITFALSFVLLGTANARSSIGPIEKAISPGSKIYLYSSQEVPGLSCGGKKINKNAAVQVTDSISMIISGGAYEVYAAPGATGKITIDCTYEVGVNPAHTNDKTASAGDLKLILNVVSQNVNHEYYFEMNALTHFEKRITGAGSVLGLSLDDVESCVVDEASKEYISCNILNGVGYGITLNSKDFILPEAVLAKATVNLKNGTKVFVTAKIENHASVLAYFGGAKCDFNGEWKEINAPSGSKKDTDILNKEHTRELDYKGGNITLPSCTWEDDKGAGDYAFRGWYFQEASENVSLASDVCTTRTLFNGTIDFKAALQSDNKNLQYNRSLFACFSRNENIVDLNVTTGGVTLTGNTSPFKLISNDKLGGLVYRASLPANEQNPTVVLPGADLNSNYAVFDSWYNEDTGTYHKAGESVGPGSYSLVYVSKYLPQEGDVIEVDKDVVIATTNNANTEKLNLSSFLNSVSSCSSANSDYVIAEYKAGKDAGGSCSIVGKKLTDNRVVVTLKGKSGNKNITILLKVKVINDSINGYETAAYSAATGNSYNITGFLTNANDSLNSCKEYTISPNSNYSRVNSIRIVDAYEYKSGESTPIAESVYSGTANCDGKTIKIAAVCIDPARQEPNGSAYYMDHPTRAGNSYIDNLTIEIYGDSDYQKAIDQVADAGKNGNVSDINRQRVAAMTLAYRILTMKAGEEAVNKSGGLEGQYYAYRDMMNNLNSHWGKDWEDNGKTFKSPATGSTAQKLLCYYKGNSKNKCKNANNKIMNMALDLIARAVGRTKTDTDSLKVSAYVSKTTMEGPDANKTYRKIVEGKFVGISTNPAITTDQFLSIIPKCAECEKYGVKVEFKIGRDKGHLVTFDQSMNVFTTTYDQIKGHNYNYPKGTHLFNDDGTMVFEYIVTGNINTITNTMRNNGGSGSGSKGSYNFNISTGVGINGESYKNATGQGNSKVNANFQRMTIFHKISGNGRSTDGKPGAFRNPNGSGDGTPCGTNCNFKINAEPSVSIRYGNNQNYKDMIIDYYYQDLTTFLPACDSGLSEYNYKSCSNSSCPDSFNPDLFVAAGCCSRILDEDNYVYKQYCSNACTQSSYSPICKSIGNRTDKVENFKINEASTPSGSEDYTCIYDTDKSLSKLKKDLKGNDYAIESFKDNQYCTVSCKEDWNFKMPTIKNHIGPNAVIAGQYFILESDKIDSIGKRTCVTSHIPLETWKNEINNLSLLEVKAFNKENVSEMLESYVNGDLTGELEINETEIKYCKDSGAEFKWRRECRDTYPYDCWDTDERDKSHCTSGSVGTCYNVSVSGPTISYQLYTSENGVVGSTSQTYQLSDSYNNFEGDSSSGKGSCKTGAELIRGDDYKSKNGKGAARVRAKLNDILDSKYLGGVDHGYEYYKNLIKEKVTDMGTCQFWGLQVNNTGKINEDPKAVTRIVTDFDPSISYQYDEKEFMDKIGGNNILRREDIKYTFSYNYYKDDGNFDKKLYTGTSAGSNSSSYTDANNNRRALIIGSGLTDLNPAEGQGDLNNKYFASCTMGGSGSHKTKGNKVGQGAGQTVSWDTEPHCSTHDHEYIENANYIKRSAAVYNEYYSDAKWFQDTVTGYREVGLCTKDCYSPVPATAKAAMEKARKDAMSKDTAGSRDINTWNLHGNGSYTDMIFPIATTTPRNIYQYTFTFRKLGNYNNKAGLGRLMGTTESIIANNNRVCFYEVVESICYCCGDVLEKELVAPSGTPTRDILNRNADGTKKSSGKDLSCNGTNCDPYLDSYNMSKQINSKDDLEKTKEQSVYGVTTNNVSLNSLTADAGREVGANWSGDQHYLLEGYIYSTDKGAKLLSNIENKGETIYEISSDNKNAPEYSYTLSPTAMSKIREMNKNNGYQEQSGDMKLAGYTSLVSTNQKKWDTSGLVPGIAHYSSNFLTKVVDSYVTAEYKDAVLSRLKTDGSSICYVIGYDGTKGFIFNGNGSNVYDANGNKVSDRTKCRWIDYVGVVKKSTNDSTSNNAGDLNDGKHYYRLSFK